MPKPVPAMVIATSSFLANFSLMVNSYNGRSIRLKKRVGPWIDTGLKRRAVFMVNFRHFHHSRANFQPFQELRRTGNELEQPRLHLVVN